MLFKLHFLMHKWIHHPEKSWHSNYIDSISQIFRKKMIGKYAHKNVKKENVSLKLSPRISQIAHIG